MAAATPNIVTSILMVSMPTVLSFGSPVLIRFSPQEMDIIPENKNQIGKMYSLCIENFINRIAADSIANIMYNTPTLRENFPDPTGLSDVSWSPA
jgi:hypothetical protein